MNLHDIIKSQKVWLVRGSNDEGYATVYFIQTDFDHEAAQIAELLDQAGLYNVDYDQITDGWITSYEETRREIINDYGLEEE